MKRRVSSTGRQDERILAEVRTARDVGAGVRYDVEISNGDDRVPGVLLMPHGHGPVPAALLLHGLGSRKERMADTIGVALQRHGIGALAVDLPMHGGRAGSPHGLQSSSPAVLLGAWGDARREATVALDYLAQHESVDPARLALVGYSLGSFIANIVAADAPAVQAVVLAASGDLPAGLPFESLVRSVVDPLRAVRALAGRPLLMVNGRFDRTVTPAQAERLFAAAQEPKTMRWYGGGHWPSPRDIDFAAEWLAAQLSDSRALQASRPTG
jgi:fermentation-respiration switch protein FrsA (DUF1100 family)